MNDPVIPNYLTPLQTTAIVIEMLKDRRLVGGLLATVVLAYLAELSSPTFSTDYYFDIGFLQSSTFAFTIDGRYLAELIRNMSGRLFPPTLLLLIGIGLLIITGFLSCIMLGVRHWLPVLLASSMLATFPLLYETFAYHALRHIVPLGFFLSVFALLHGGICRRWLPSLVGIGGLVMALLLYQSTIYFAIVLTVFAAGIRILDGEPAVATAKAFLLPRAAATLAALSIYWAILSISSSVFGIAAGRLESMAGLTVETAQIIAAATMITKVLGELLAQDTFLFPIAAKVAFLGVVALLAIGLIHRAASMGVRNALVAIVLLGSTPFLTFGSAWVSSNPAALLNDRIMISFAAIYLGAFLVSWSILNRLRGVLAGAGALIVGIFIYQTNVWHMYMDLKNRADMDIASKISETVKRQPEYRPWLPLVLIGTYDAVDYQPYRTFPIQRDTLSNSSLVSAFAKGWSSPRVLTFFLPFAGPTPEQVERMERLTEELPSWPDPRSVIVAEDTIGVVLGR